MFLTAEEVQPAYSSGVLLLIAAAAVAVLLLLISGAVFASVGDRGGAGGVVRAVAGGSVDAGVGRDRCTRASVRG